MWHAGKNSTPNGFILLRSENKTNLGMWTDLNWDLSFKVILDFFFSKCSMLCYYFNSNTSTFCYPYGFTITIFAKYFKAKVVHKNKSSLHQPLFEAATTPPFNKARWGSWTNVLFPILQQRMGLENCIFLVNQYKE